LIELAIAIFVVVLVLGSILVPLSSQVEQRQARETLRELDEIREALVGFALAKGYLPCPDQTSGAGSNDGAEDVAGSGACSVVSGSNPNFFSMGNVPWVTLGLGSRDAWGNRYRYVVLSGFAQRSPATVFTLVSSVNMGNLRVCDTAACATTLSTTAVAVILSHGANGYGAINSISGTANPASASADEQENYDTDRDLVSRPRYTGGLDASEFDDIVVWLSRYTLFNRLVSGGVLP
jgi:type II secretory pathway pseudopilin PulG